MIMGVFLKNFGKLSETVRRFFLPVLCSVLFTMVGLWTNFEDSKESFDYLYLLSFGFFWFIAAKLFMEAHGYGKKVCYVLSVGIFLAVSWYGYHSSKASYSLLLSIAFLLIYISPYFFRRVEEEVIWTFNYRMLSGLFSAVLVGMVLFLGITVIIGSTSYLFNIEFRDDLYMKVWIIVAGFFGPIFGLSMVPRNYEEDSSKISLKEVARLMIYLCIPLLMLYAVVLYAYIVKVIILWELPKGDVTYLVMSFGCLGLLTYFFTYPMTLRGEYKDYAVVRWFYKYFFGILVLPIVLMAVAIGMRVYEYGVTNSRYVVMALVVFFASIVGMFLMRFNVSKLKCVYLTAIVLLIVSFHGPLSMERVVINSQFGRLVYLLEKNKMVKHGKIVSKGKHVSKEDTEAISSIVDYFVDSRKVRVLKPLFSELVASRINTVEESELEAKVIVEDMGVGYIKSWGCSDEGVGCL